MVDDEQRSVAFSGALKKKNVRFTQQRKYYKRQKEEQINGNCNRSLYESC